MSISPQLHPNLANESLAEATSEPYSKQGTKSPVEG
jgi:hypothetical protein